MLYQATKLGSPTSLLNSVLVLPGLDPALLAEKGYLVLLLLEVTIIIIIIIIIIQPFQLGCCE